MQRPSDKKIPRNNRGILFCGKVKQTILLALLSAALASGLLTLLAGLLLAALLVALLLPALLNVSHFLVRHGGVLLRGPIPRDNNLSGPSLVQL